MKNPILLKIAILSLGMLAFSTAHAYRGGGVERSTTINSDLNGNDRSMTVNENTTREVQNGEVNVNRNTTVETPNGTVTETNTRTYNDPAVQYRIRQNQYEEEQGYQ